MDGTPRLRTVTRTQGNNEALKTGAVTPHGFRFDFEEVPVLVDAFRRMVRGLEFDVSEMALTTYLVAKAHGSRPSPPSSSAVSTTARSTTTPPRTSAGPRTWRAAGSA
ncbi:hypothetical protein ACFV3E_20435 [Streptomyces sp. NPDC059718]